jgi:hypothetical protein
VVACNAVHSIAADTRHPFELLQAAYDGSYLAKQLDIGTGAALATDTGAAKTIGRALVGAARVFTDKVQSVSNTACTPVGSLQCMFPGLQHPKAWP